MATRKYVQSRRAVSAEETRLRVLEVLREHLRTNPTRPVSLDQIATDADVARSTVYVIFGSRAGLFRALGEELLERGGFDRLLEAVADPDVRVHLREGIRVNCELCATDHEVQRALWFMGHVDPDAFGGLVQFRDDERSGGMTWLVKRLADEGLLRPGVSRKEAADMLWSLTSFGTFDLLYSERGMSVPRIAKLLIATAERTLLREDPGSA